jgi:hypothetical protein
LVAVGQLGAGTSAIGDRVRRTIALLRRRGYAVSAARLGQLCLGGEVDEAVVRWSVAAGKDLAVAEGLVLDREALKQAPSIRSRARAHLDESASYVAMSVEFVRTLVAIAPFIRSVSLAGSLASGGFRSSDDIDLNLIVDDGYRHLAYVAVNVLGILHALRHRSKPVDSLTRRPIAPRLMTANLILERTQCLPLARQDEDMAFELLIAEPVFGFDAVCEVIDANRHLLEHFPQLREKRAPLLIDAPRRRAPRMLYPALLDRPAKLLGHSAWRYMQWTRRKRPDALARVAYVRATMRPYALFDPN